MEFKQENIGKFVFTKSYRDDPKLFRIIIGYNPIVGRYVAYSFDANGLWGHYSSITPDEEMYTIEYATQYLTEQISELTAQREELLDNVNLVNDTMKRTSRENYKNELRKLWRSYSECSRQLKFFIEENSHFHRDIYGIEIREMQKAIRRLNKRFRFFFGDKAELLQDAICNAGPYDSLRARLGVVESNLKKLEHCKRSMHGFSLKLSEAV